jgi:hypothetical protein
MRDLLSILDAISDSDLTKINEQQEPTESQMDKSISDLYKDVYGYRPDRDWGENWMRKNEDEKRRVYDQLADMLAADDDGIEDPREYAERSADLDAEHYGKSESIFQIGDEFGISLSEDFEIAASVIGIADKAVIISLDETAIQYLSDNGFIFEELSEAKANANFDAEDIMKLQTLDDVESMKEKALELISKPSRRPMKPEKVEWFKNALSNMTGKDQVIKLMYDLLLSGEGFGVIGSRSSMRPSGYRQRFNDSITNEAEYQGRKVELNKPMAGDVKKSKVYVKGPKGNVVKVNFGDKTMRIKKSNPARRKSFRARHNCANPGPRHKARYWSCRAW